MPRQTTIANLLLLLVAFIWGSTFVAQRLGTAHVGAFTFNAARFLLGAAALLPVAWPRLRKEFSLRPALLLGGSLLAGIFLCAGINLQQLGLATTTAANAGFITGLYVVIVPFIGRFFGLRYGRGVWLGAALCIVGLYLIGVSGKMKLVPGDLWVLAGAFAWAFHVLAIGWLAPRIDSFALAFGQTLVCALLSLAVALLGKTLDMSGIMAAIWPLLFCGIITTGVAFTIQVVAQKNTSPAHAALIMQLETVFAALSGWLLLGETMSLRGLMGAALILAGMLVSQFWHASRG